MSMGYTGNYKIKKNQTLPMALYWYENIKKLKKNHTRPLSHTDL